MCMEGHSSVFKITGYELDEWSFIPDMIIDFDGFAKKRCKNTPISFIVYVYTPPSSHVKLENCWKVFDKILYRAILLQFDEEVPDLIKIGFTNGGSLTPDLR